MAMIEVVGHHGVHIHFLSYMLEVMSDQRNALEKVPSIFDNTPHRKFFVPSISNASTETDRVIWIAPHNRLLFAYNLFTRSIQNITEEMHYYGNDPSVEKWVSSLNFDFSNFTIHDWEQYPTKYVLGCGMVSHQYDNLARFSRPDGSVEKQKMIWWYLKEILTHDARYYQPLKINADVIQVPNSMFYDIDLCENYIKKINDHFSLKLDFAQFEKLYDQLKSTITYDKNSVLQDGSCLSCSYHAVGQDLRDIIYPSL